ncbi:multiprotein bridging factor aMBF1, partial [Candidatus Woesearchaeota archaeon]|nr:multiprotein bridging factor aMBF1 [Candidatus Woesearchaeota archaeon]
MCGSDEQLFVAEVEGSRLNICKKCGKFGKIIASARPLAPAIKKKTIEKEPEPEIIRTIIPDFSKIIRKSRENLGLKQKEFAEKIKEKESVVHKLETGEFTPSLSLAGKLEKILDIKLITEYLEKKDLVLTKSEESLTIGDMIKIKKRK